MSLTFDRVSKSFKDIKVLDSFSIKFPEKGVVCFFGKSGIGKTTILNLISEIIRPDSGDIKGLENKKVSFAFQDERLLLWSTVIENVSIVVSEKNNIGKKEIAKKWLKRFGLLESYNKKPGDLSGGMRQRLVLARALAFDSDIILLDEPFKGLDNFSKDILIDLIKKHTKDKLLVVVTHSTYEALKLSNIIYILKGMPIKITEKIIVDLLDVDKSEDDSDFLKYQKRIMYALEN